MAMDNNEQQQGAVPLNAVKSSTGQPDWPGLLKWSLAHSDSSSQAPRNLSDDDKKWFMEAMQANTVDVVRRMKELSLVLQAPKQVLEKQGVSPQDIEGVLEELQEHVESIDMANDLKSVGGLGPVIGLLKDEHSPIRAKSAEVLSTMVQNNPKCQADVMEHKGLEALLSNFSSDPDVTVRTKALGAISSLIRNNSLATAAFRLGNGFSSLEEALASENSKLQRKALQVTQYLLQQNPRDNITAAELGFPQMLTRLARDENPDVREGALQAILEVSRNDQASVMSWGSGNKELKHFLETRIGSLEKLNPEELSPLKEERILLDTLWSSCVGQPSSLREKGLLVLPGEDELPPDVAGKLFEPALRGLSTRPEPEPKPENSGSSSDDKPPLLLKL